MKTSCRNSSGWLQLIFHFGAENLGDYLKKNQTLFAFQEKRLSMRRNQVQRQKGKNSRFNRNKKSKLQLLKHFVEYSNSFKQEQEIKRRCRDLIQALIEHGIISE